VGTESSKLVAEASKKQLEAAARRDAEAKPQKEVKKAQALLTPEVESRPKEHTKRNRNDAMSDEEDGEGCVYPTEALFPAPVLL
jgi:hypothetical protein